MLHNLSLTLFLSGVKSNLNLQGVLRNEVEGGALSGFFFRWGRAKYSGAVSRVVFTPTKTATKIWKLSLIWPIVSYL